MVKSYNRNCHPVTTQDHFTTFQRVAARLSDVLLDVANYIFRNPAKMFTNF